MRIHPYRKDGGLVAGLVLSFVDITKMKKSEQMLREAVLEREQAEVALREADRHKDEFLAVLAHELRNPLAPVRNGLDVLSRVAEGSEKAKQVQAVMHRQIGHLTRIVDDLLDVTRIARGKVLLHRAPVELGDLIARTTDDYRAVLEERGVKLEIGAPGEPTWIDGDATRLAQVIGNLLHNASKFTPPGGHVRISLGREPPGSAVLRVEDDGMGIDPAMLPRLFEAFVQADESLDRVRGGLGLGLALVKGLAELHGGSVEARSEGNGKGSVFTIRLPLASPPTSPPNVGEEDHAHVPRRVLVIEDNVDGAAMLKELLELGGHTVAVAGDGIEGLEKARQFSPDVVLCDIGLPNMDGYDVARAFRADAALGGIFLVALSGYATPEDRQRASDAGFARHLAKPLGPEQLDAVLADVTPR